LILPLWPTPSIIKKWEKWRRGEEGRIDLARNVAAVAAFVKKWQEMKIERGREREGETATYIGHWILYLEPSRLKSTVLNNSV
jgi:hypothetical protein